MGIQEITIKQQDELNIVTVFEKKRWTTKSNMSNTKRGMVYKQVQQ